MLVVNMGMLLLQVNIVIMFMYMDNGFMSVLMFVHPTFMFMRMIVFDFGMAVLMFM